MNSEAPLPRENPPFPTARIDSRYDNLQRLAEGGMAQVFLARDTLTNENVVIKDLVCTLRDHGKVRHFLRHEGNVLQTMCHRHVVGFRALREDPEGIPYVVMEHIAAPTVFDAFQLSEEKPWPIRTPSDCIPVFRCFFQACLGLRHAHEKGLLHADIKPDNILRSPERTVLIDWALSKPINSQLQVPCGTPGYLVPENVMRKTITEESDVFALAATLFHVLTGRMIYEDIAPIAVVPKFRSGLAADCRIRSVHPRVPKVVADVCERALDGLPENRQTLSQFCEELRQFLRMALRDQPIDTFPDTSLLFPAN